MKTYTKQVVSFMAALTVSVMLSSTLNAGGLGTARGGAADLMRRPSFVAEAPATTAMACPKCKTEYAVKKDWTGRGAIKSDKVLAKHLCNECGTELKTVGTGKHAVDLAVHTCVACKN
jgi:hypothetical protein